jgi:signal peptidase
MTTRKAALCVLAWLLCAVVVTIGVGWVKGYRVYVVHTGSMLPTMPIGSVVIDRPTAGIAGLKPGDIITFRHSDLTTDLVTHRIASLDGGLVQTKGDANTSTDTWNIRPNQVTGERIATIPEVGYLLVFLQQPSAIGATVVTPLLILLLWSVFFPNSAPIRRPAHRASRRRPIFASPTAR